MTPKIINITEKKLVGKWLKMSLATNKTAELWKSFMPFQKEISKKLSEDLVSMQVYEPGYFKNFNPTREFEKWAAIEVADFENIPKNMESFLLPSGKYAVFHYKGPANDPSPFQYIFNIWLPNSEFLLDDRPHFEILGDTYKNHSPESEEEIWIPIK